MFEIIRQIPEIRCRKKVSSFHQLRSGKDYNYLATSESQVKYFIMNRFVFLLDLHYLCRQKLIKMSGLCAFTTFL